VNVNADPLQAGIFGQDLKTTIDTRRSGPGIRNFDKFLVFKIEFIMICIGELTAQCVGPNKVAFCELMDQKDGTYLLLIKPQETGKHTLIVKYNDEHVPGKPTYANITYCS